MADVVQLYDGDTARLTFQYDNVAKNKSRKGATYYTFTCEEGKFHCNNHCLRQIQQAWPGKGGGFEIHRVDAGAYKITGVEIGTPGELKMVAWKDPDGFQPCEFDLAKPRQWTSPLRGPHSPAQPLLPIMKVKLWRTSLAYSVRLWCSLARIGWR